MMSENKTEAIEGKLMAIAPVSYVENELTYITEYLSWIIAEQGEKIDELEAKLLEAKESYKVLSDNYDRVSFDLERICGLLPGNEQKKIKEN